uniref:Potassium voltage-gated channel subfamily KQT member n=3 Tax=Daphnia magna TaxID=35525 RepID=A0A0P6GRC1_9CRUS
MEPRDPESLKCRHKSTPWSRSDEDEEGEDDYTGSPSVEASAEQRMLAPSILYKSSPLLDSSPATPKSPTTASIELHRQLLALRRGSRASRGSTGMIEMVEDALGGTVVPPNVAANGGSGSMDARYRKWQTRLYNFLERPRGSKAIAYHVVVFVMVFACLALSVFSTIEEFQESADVALLYMEGLVVFWFTVEFVFRLWSSGCRSRYQGFLGRLKFLRRPFCVIDVVTIVASVVVISLGSGGQVFATSALRGLRFFQILRMVRMDRRGGTWKLLGSVVYAHRQELFTTVYIGFLALIFSSFLMYLAEKEANPDKFSNFADALWWGVITLSTVGYGDAFPITWQGKLIASGCALMGICFFALPSGILGSGFALKVQQQQRQKHMIRRRQPAASLIQCLWRCCAADGLFRSVATWKVHMPSPSSYKHNTSFVMTRLPTIRRAKAPPPAHKIAMASANLAGCAISGQIHETNEYGAQITNNGINRKPVHESSRNSSDEDEEHPVRYTQLTPQYRMAIRAIRKMKFLVARRKFKEALKPYDVKDVIEQYSAGHVDLLGRVKALQARLDQILGKQGSSSKGKDIYDNKYCLASRIVNVERQVGDIEVKVQRILELCLENRQSKTNSNESGGSASQTDVPSSESVPLSRIEAAISRPDPPSSLGLACSSSMSHPLTLQAPLKPILVLDRGHETPANMTDAHHHQEQQQGQEEHEQQHQASPVKKRVTLQSL